MRLNPDRCPCPTCQQDGLGCLVAFIWTTTLLNSIGLFILFHKAWNTDWLWSK